MCFCWSCIAGVARLACLLVWYFLFSVVLTGAWRWAVAWLPWWPPYCWGDCCPPLLLPLRHLPSNIQLAWSLMLDSQTKFIYRREERANKKGCLENEDWRPKALWSKTKIHWLPPTVSEIDLISVAHKLKYHLDTRQTWLVKLRKRNSILTDL